MKKLVIYTDGASRGNPGHAGIGIVMKDENEKIVKEISDYIGETTNNIAEYTALVTALKTALEIYSEDVEVISDSELMVKQINGEYKVKNQGIKPLFEEATRLIKQFKSFSIRHVKREFNKEADELANIGIDEAVDEQEIDI